MSDLKKITRGWWDRFDTDDRRVERPSDAWLDRSNRILREMCAQDGMPPLSTLEVIPDPPRIYALWWWGEMYVAHLAIDCEQVRLGCSCEGDRTWMLSIELDADDPRLIKQLMTLIRLTQKEAS